MRYANVDALVPPIPKPPMAIDCFVRRIICIGPIAKTESRFQFVSIEPHNAGVRAYGRVNSILRSPITEFIPPITSHPQHDQQHTRDTARHRPRDSQLAESH